MADVVELVAEPRQTRGSQKARQLRRRGQVPAVVYGHQEAAVSVSLPAEGLLSAIRHKAHVVNLKTGAGVEKALIKDIQWDHLGKEVLHVDFARIAEDERVAVTVPVELRGIAPGISHNGILEQPLHILRVECLAISIPDSIRVNVSTLDVGQAIHVKDVTLPPGVQVLDDPDAIVVHVVAKMAEPEAAPAAPAAEQAEPEVIGRKVAEEGEEGE